MFKSLKFLPALFLLSVSIYGQSDFRPGMIFKTPDDSISGMIDYRNDIRNTTQCLFRFDADSSGSFKPFEIYGYRFTPGKFYISRYVRTRDAVTPFFIEYLVKGKKNLYYLRNGSGAHFLIDAGKDTVREVVYKVDHPIVDGVEYIGDAKIHQAYLKAYFNDCPSLFKDIEKIEVPDINNMVSLTKEYHRFMCRDTGCIVFYKKTARFRVDVEFRYGLIWYVEPSTSFEPQYGGLAHFWLPRSNERMYLVTGFLIGPLKNYGNNYFIYKVPLKFEYRFPFRIIKPKFEGGVNFMVLSENKKQDGIGIDFPLSAGVLICPVSFLGFNLSVEGEFWPFFFMDEFKIKHMLNAYSFNFGLSIRL